MQNTSRHKTKCIITMQSIFSKIITTMLTGNQLQIIRLQILNCNIEPGETEFFKIATK